MLSGTVYSLVGIRNKHLHICLSACYLASLAVSVLILYVMNPPISNAIQSAYLVAVAMTGLILGGAAIVFSELTEGLGCLLGGFCMSMWLLVLKPGGLLTSTSAKSSFVAVFTLAAFATSFSHITRPYSLIGLISFGGATVVVLGIDCVSRAGLKEFWAYIWNLNDDLFPLGATTYPLTRGMKVEIAAIVVVSLAGVMSQMKLWQVIKGRRDLRAAERLKGERAIQREEENIGKRIEENNGHERQQWEAVYGDKEPSTSKENQSDRDSGVGDMDSQKKGPTSTIASLRRSADDEIELVDMPSPKTKARAGLIMHGKGGGSPITVRVVRDSEPPTNLDENGNPVEHFERRLSHDSLHKSLADSAKDGSAMDLGADGEASREGGRSNIDSRRNSKRESAGPEIVPLPFKVPDDQVEIENSSVATFADDDLATEKRKYKRLSAGSAFLRRLSKASRQSSKHYSRGAGESTDDLIIPRAMDKRPNSRASSLVATMDELSDEEDYLRSTRSSVVQVEDTNKAAVPQITSEEDAAFHTNLATENLEDTTQRLSPVAVFNAVLDRHEPHSKGPDQPTQEATALVSRLDPKAGKDRPASAEPDSDDTEKPANDASSVVSAAGSKHATLTKESLPPSLSRVVMSYRTNEWAKHLSAADAPDLEELRQSEYLAEIEEENIEVVAPVNIDELQQTAENASMAPAKSASQISNRPTLTRLSSSVSKLHASPYASQPKVLNGIALSRSTSQLSIHSPQAGHSTRFPFRSPSMPIIQPIGESYIEDEAKLPQNKRNTYGRQSTLIGQRETMIRSQSSPYVASRLSSTPKSPAPHPQQQSQSQPRSQIGSSSPSQVGSEDLPEDDNMSLSQRRDLIRQQSQVQQPIPLDTHQPQRQSSAPQPLAREHQLASFRASVQNEFMSATKPRASMERQRSKLWMEKQAEEQRRQLKGRMREVRDRGINERMRKGDMLGAHREALRRMQAKATGIT